MKTIGLIGGVSPESTVLYYRHLNAAARAALGGDHSARLVINSVDFGHIHELYAAEDWDGFRAEITGAAKQLEAAGCAAVAILSNTTQMAEPAVRDAISIPFISMFEALASALNKAGVSRPLLVGTPFVMEGDYYRPRLASEFSIETKVPSAEDQAEVNRIIFEELVRGEVRDASRATYLRIIEEAGADAAILGCTEIAMLVDQSHTEVPLFDTTSLHAAAIAKVMLV